MWSHTSKHFFLTTGEGLHQWHPVGNLINTTSQPPVLMQHSSTPQSSTSFSASANVVAGSISSLALMLQINGGSESQGKRGPGNIQTPYPSSTHPRDNQHGLSFSWHTQHTHSRLHCCCKSGRSAMEGQQGVNGCLIKLWGGRAGLPEMPDALNEKHVRGCISKGSTAMTH